MAFESLLTFGGKPQSLMGGNKSFKILCNDTDVSTSLPSEFPFRVRFRRTVIASFIAKDCDLCIRDS